MAPTPIVPTPSGVAILTALWEKDIDEAAKRGDLERLQQDRDNHALSCVAALSNGSVEAAQIFARVSARAEEHASRLRAEVIGKVRVLHRPFAVTEQLAAADA